MKVITGSSLSRAAALALALSVLCVLGLTLVATSGAIELCGYTHCTIYGPRSPGKPHTDRGMHATVTPTRASGDVYFYGHARGFKPREFVTVWEYRPNGNVSFMPSGGNASRKGLFSASVKIFGNGVDPGGVWHLCFKGLRTKRVACAAFVVVADQGRTPFAGPGGPGSSPSPGGSTPPSGSGSGGSNPPSGSGSGGSNPPSGSGSTPPSCGAWNVAGAWKWVSDGFGLGPGNGPATLSQSGSNVTGTINDGSSSGNWTLSGSVSGSTLHLTMTAPGYAGVPNYTGTISSNMITGSGYGSFTEGTAKCVG